MDTEMAEHTAASPLSRPPDALPLPARAITVVEHPCIVKNVDKGVASLGGAIKLSKALTAKHGNGEESDDDAFEGSVSVSLRPDDPFAKRLLSAPVPTNNLLLKVTAPKRTGRKRKRGSSGPFLTEIELEATPSTGSSTTGTQSKANSPYVGASVVYQSIKDNPSKFSVALVGVIEETHRFRKLPDLQWAASQDENMQNIRDSLLPLRYRDFDKLNLNLNPGPILDKHIGPSAEFIQMPVAYNYRYQQNSFVKYDSHGKTEVNIGKSLARGGYHIIPPTAVKIPKTPKSHLPPENSLTPYLQTVIADVRAQLAERPIITRHLLYNRLGWNRRDRIREALVYCGYFFETGPWREALVAWGLDPRNDPAFRKYQTVHFSSYSRKQKTELADHIARLAAMPTEELKDEHIFDGKKVSTTGNLYQFCDVTDPLLRTILDTDDLRSTCAPTFQGWYHVGTWAKATVILKDKMDSIIRTGTADDALYQRISSWPELWDDKEMHATYRSEAQKRDIEDRPSKKREWDLMGSVRAAARNPKFAFERMEAANASVRAGVAENGEGEAANELEVPEDMTEQPDRVDVEDGEADAGDEPSDESESEEDGDRGGGDEEEDEEEGEGEEDDWSNEDASDIEGLAEVEEQQPQRQPQGARPFGGLM